MARVGATPKLKGSSAAAVVWTREAGSTRLDSTLRTEAVPTESEPREEATPHSTLSRSSLAPPAHDSTLTQQAATRRKRVNGWNSIELRSRARQQGHRPGRRFNNCILTYGMRWRHSIRCRSIIHIASAVCLDVSQ
jgi:hypothetical protein